jgi:hypothetical protein
MTKEIHGYCGITDVPVVSFPRRHSVNQTFPSRDVGPVFGEKLTSAGKVDSSVAAQSCQQILLGVTLGTRERVRAGADAAQGNLPPARFQGGNSAAF